MNESPFTRFIELITFDQALAALEAEERNLAHQIQLLNDQEQGLLNDSEHAKKLWHNAQKEVDAKELEMEDLVTKEAAKKKRLETVTNHKEYQSYKLEIDKLNAQQREVEAALLEAWAGLEQAAKAFEMSKMKNGSQLDHVRNEIAQKLHKQTETVATIAGQLKLRPEKEQQVPDEWLQKYALMRARVPDPVVSVSRGSCTACYFKVSEQDMLDLARNKLLQCKGCYRLLFLESAQHTPAA